MSQSWRIISSSPYNFPDKMYALARFRGSGTPSLAYTLDVRVRRTPNDLARVIGADLANKMSVSEIVEGLVLFETITCAGRYTSMEGDNLNVFSLDPNIALDTMLEHGGVVVSVDGDDPPSPSYCKKMLLSIAHDLGDVPD